MKKCKKTAIFLILVFILQLIPAVPVQAEGYSDYLEQVLKMAKDRYYQDVSDEELLKGALRGIFNSMDEYTTFYDLDEAGNFLSTMQGNYQGIGVEISGVPEGVIVVRVFENSPAEGAGILPDDIITRVDGKDVSGMTAQDISNLIRGESGTYVELGIIRGGTQGIITIRVQRGSVNISPVKWMIDGDVMYIRLESFSGNSSHFFEQALKEMDNRGLKKMILDLRNNPGGEVAQAVAIARKLVRSGVITKLDFKSEDTRDITYYSFLYKPKYIPAVLVNGKTASASEILASAIQDSKDGFIVGTKTFGKGVVQNLYPVLKPEAYERYAALYGDNFVDGYQWANNHGVVISESDLIGWVKITTGHYLTRNGRAIHNIGVLPDFEVDDYELVNGIDIQSIKPLEHENDILLNGIGNDVYSAEKILAVKGAEIDAPDNILDQKTSDALVQFQKEKGIPSTGILDKATKAALNEELKELRLKIDRQYSKALELLGYF
ncbi:MAG: S41 family peptidase [Clostridiaceae bacterium]|nr:S41 family peptidase [Clostridiaceae bacterium]